MKKVSLLFLMVVITTILHAQSRQELANSNKAAQASSFVAMGAFENCWEAELLTDQTTLQVPFLEGPGEYDLVDATSCLISDEHQVRWYKFSFSNPGTFEFICTPNNMMADIDFALWRGACPSGLCSDLPSELVSCNYIGSITIPPFLPTGIATDPMASFGVPNNNEIIQTIFVEPDINYYLLIDNISFNGEGYSLEFGGSANFETSVGPLDIVPGIDCASAPLLECPCLEGGVQLETGPSNVTDLPPSFCGSIENEQWVSFEACWCTYDLILENGNCLLNQGIEAQLFSTCGSSYIPKTNCITVLPGETGQFTDVNCLIGEQLYLMVDGVFGDQCDYSLRIEEKPGNQVIILQDTIFGQVSVCEGDSIVYYSPPVIGAAHCDYEYDGNGDVENPSHDSVTVVFGPGDGRLCFIAEDCDEIRQVCIDIEVFPIDTSITDSVVICSSDLPFVFGTLSINESGLYTYDSLSNSSGCDSFLQIYVEVIDAFQANILVTGDIHDPGGALLENQWYDPMDAFDYLWAGPGITALNEGNTTQQATEPGNYELTVADPVSGCSAYSSLFLSGIDTCSTFNYPVAPADSCINAPPFCADYLNGYCSINDVLLTDVPGNLADVFGCTIENMQWLSFVPCEPTVNFEFSVGNCIIGEGLQFAVLESDNCNDFTSMANCMTVLSGDTETLTINNLTPGESYYLVIDGFSAAVCQWQITGLQGVAGEAYLQEDNTPGYIEGEGDICLGLAGPPSDAFQYSVVGPICQLIPIDTTCNGEPVTCVAAPQLYCEPHLDTLYQPIAYDTIWYIDPPEAGSFVNGDSIGSVVDIVWDSVGTFYLEVEIKAVEFDTIPFWNNCLTNCTQVCPDPEGDGCIIERKEINISSPDEFYFAFTICPGECVEIPLGGSGGTAPPPQDTISYSGGPGSIEFCGAGVYEFYVEDAGGCIDFYRVEVTEFDPQNIFLTLEEECPGECVTYGGQVYCEGVHQIIEVDQNGCTIFINLTVIGKEGGNVFINGSGVIDCNSPFAVLDAFTDYNGIVNYLWSTGETGQTIVVDYGGQFTVSVFDGNCFIGESSFVVIENIVEEEEDLGDIFLCPGECFTLLGIEYCDEGDYEEVFTDPSSGCTTTYFFTIIIENNLPLQIGPVSEICDGINENYFVGFTIDNGVPPFMVNGDVINGNFYESDPIPTGDPYFFEVTDNNACGLNTTTVQGIYECFCVSEAGTMGTSLLNQCEDEMVIVDYNNDAMFDDNDVLLFVIHDNAGNSLGNTFGVNATGTFGFDPASMSFGTTYYISPVVGNAMNGSIDFSDNCTSVGQGQPVQFYEMPQLMIIPPIKLDCNNPSVIIDNMIVGGTGNIIYDWSGPNGYQSTDPSPAVVEGGDYICIITDAQSGCTDESAIFIESDFETPDVAIIGDEIIDCNVETITLEIGGAAANVTYNWTLPSGDVMDGPLISTNMGGLYTVLATGDNGCITESTIEITENTAAPFLEASDGVIDCNNSVVSLSAFSGEPGVDFYWILTNGDTSAGVSITTGQAGDYSVVATGLNGCTSLEFVEVAEDLSPPDVMASGGEITCDSTSITILASSNDPGVQYSWVFPTGNEVGGASAETSVVGNYTLIATGANGCTNTATTEVTIDEAVPAFTVSDGAVDCLNTVDTLNISTSQQGLTFTWLLPDGSQASGESIFSDLPGVYEVTAAGLNGCSTTLTTSIEDNIEVPDVAVSYGMLNCLQSSTMITASSPSSMVSYTWTYPNGAEFTGNDLVVTEPGNYSLIALADNGCTYSESFEVEQDIEEPSLTLLGDSIACNNPTVSLLASSNDPNIVFIWTAPDGSTFNGPLLETSLAGIYNVTATALNGCESEDILMVAEMDGPSLTLSPEVEDPTCFNDMDGYIIIGDVIGATMPLTTVINGQEILQNTLSGIGAGTYEVLVTDANGCTGLTEIELTNPQEVIVELGDDLSLAMNTPLSLDFQSSIVPSTIQWIGPNNQEWSGVQSLSILATQNGLYQITITDDNGCAATDEINIFVNGDGMVYIPNAFSPNGDANNDYATIYAGAEVEEVSSFMIFNRWGDMVFSKESFEPNIPNLGWDGRFKNQEMNPGTFAYKAEVVFKTGEMKTITGELVLIR